TQDLLRDMNERRMTIEKFPITSEILGTLLKRISDSVLTVKSAREVFGVLLERADAQESIHSSDIDAIVDERRLAVVNDTGALETAIAKAISESDKAVEDFRAGKQQALGAIIGKVMKQVKGADPKQVREM